MVFLTSGCQLRLQVRVLVEGDASGQLEVEIGADQELTDLAEEAGVDPLARLVERVDALGGPWSVQDLPPREGGGQPGSVLLSAPFADPAEFDVLYAQLETALVAPEATLIGPMRLVVDEEADTVTVSGTSTILVNQVAADDLGLPLAEVQSLAADALAYQLVVGIPAPGLPQSVPAGQPVDPEDPEGAQVVTLSPAVGGAEPFDITFTPPGFDFTDYVIPVGGGLLAVVVIGLGVVAERHRVRR